VKKMTLKQAFDRTEELWKWLAGGDEREKHEWPKWKENGGKYKETYNDCFFCEYAILKGGIVSICEVCPINYPLRKGCGKGNYDKWNDNLPTAENAQAFLDEIRERRKELNV